jgi:ankyrin repeat protein
VVGHNPSAIKMEVEAANAFVQAALGGRMEKMVAALTTVRDVNVIGQVARVGYIVSGTALYFASHQGKLEAVRWLLVQEGIDVNLGNTYGTSPLHIASWFGHEAVVEALIAAGADVNHQNRGGYTALMGASAYGHTTIARCLIAAGARVNHVTPRGFTALDCARPHPDTVKLLLTHRAMPGTLTYLSALHMCLPRLTDTDAPFALSPEEALPGVLSGTDVFGRTALHYAALTGDRAAYAVLHSVMRWIGVDTEGVDGGGYTALDHLVCARVSTTDNFSRHPHPQGLTPWSHRRSILRVLTAIGQVL